MSEPHSPDSCGIVKARRERQLAFDVPRAPVFVNDRGEDKKKGK